MEVHSSLFPIDRLGAWDVTHPGNALRALFDRWSLPGQKADRSVPLRLCLGDGYLEFFVRGQSFAKLTLGLGGPRLSVPLAYVAGRSKTWSSDASSSMQGFQEFDADGLANPTTCSLISAWINTAETYASAQQRFVDDLIAANPGTLNLEVGDTKGDVPEVTRSSLHTNLVIAQRLAGEPLSICLWTVTLGGSPGLRAPNRGSPMILEQLAELQRLLMEPNRIAEIQRASREAAIAYLGQQSLFGARDNYGRECVNGWKAMAEHQLPAFAGQLGLVIGNYWPDGYREPIASGRMSQHAAKFAKNWHRAKIEKTGIRVHEVGRDHGET